MQTTIDIKILDQRLKDDPALLPAYGTAFSAGFDLRACIDKPLVLVPNQCELVGTGIAFYLADPNLAGVMAPRSGLGHKHGLICGTAIGILDSDYQGQLMVSLWNRSAKPYVVQPMDRVAQLMIVPVLQVGFNVVDSFEDSARGAGGFGSTGTR